MSINILTEFSDRVRYFLSSKSFGALQIQEPIGWNEDDKEFSRNKEYHGVFTTLSNSLKFTKSSKSFIELVDATDGINADLRLFKQTKNSITDIWESSYGGYLDLSTREVENNQLSLKFNAGGLEALIKNRESEDVEIDRLESLEGKQLAPLKTDKINLKGRRIYLESTWRASSMTYYQSLQVETKAQDGNKRSQSNTFPFEIFKKSQEQANSIYDGLTGTDVNGQTSMMLLIPVDRKREFKVNINDLEFAYYGLNNSKVDWGAVTISLVKYTNGGSYDRLASSVIELWKYDIVSNSSIKASTTKINNHTISITLEQGESLGLEVLLVADFERNIGAAGATVRRDFYYKLLGGSITIQEDSVFNPTLCEAIKPFDLANRLVEIITGRKNAVRSEILQKGKWKHLMITHGFWVRGFSKEIDSELPEEQMKFKPLTTNFKDFISSLAAVCNIGLGIEKIGAREYLVIEDLKYFYNRNTTLKLPHQVGKVKRSTDASLYYKSVEFGYEKGGEYEEAMGLDEYNVRNNYTTCIHRVDYKYSKLSKYRADSYGIEFARRKPFKDYSTEDTPYDQDIFLIDCKDTPIKINIPLGPLSKPYQTIDLFQARTWHDDFTNPPKGVFSIETAFNLRLTPLNSLLRHGWIIASGLTKYPDHKISYSSSDGNSSLETIYPENGYVVNSELERGRFIPEVIEFEHIVTDEMIKQLEGFTTILGKQIRNCYGVVEFINEDGNIEKGYLQSLKPNGNGQWTLLKYNE